MASSRPVYQGWSAVLASVCALVLMSSCSHAVHSSAPTLVSIAVTAMETRVGAEECTACEQLDIRTRAQTEAKTALHPWYTGRELAILKSSNKVDYLRCERTLDAHTCGSVTRRDDPSTAIITSSAFATRNQRANVD